ncbi:MAG: FecR domain-containing protein [Parabacteroides sp.]
MEEDDSIKNHIVDCLCNDTVKGDPILGQWLAEEALHKQEFDQYKKIWNESCHYIDSETFDSVSAWNHINEQNIQEMQKQHFTTKLLYMVSGVAAAGLILFVLSLAGLFDRPANSAISFHSAYGSNASVILPEGSYVDLNAGSTMAYAYNAKEKIREVKFSGEGFFHVSKSKYPFVIKLAEGLKVRVWGTSFNLQAYNNESIIEASLVEGKIELTHGNHKLMMKPGEMASFDKKTHNINFVNGVSSHAYGWLNNKLYMDDMSLAQVCRYLERRYDVNINTSTNMADSIHYTGVLKEETVVDILQALSRLSSINYSIKGKNISITPKSRLPMKK